MRGEPWRQRLTLPNYGIGEAARYAHISASTVGRWHKNTTLPSREARSKLSYLELIEVAVVATCRNAGMKLTDIRLAREYLAEAFRQEYPFATLQLKTDGVDLLKDHGADLLVANRGGQLAWKDIIARRFQEFEYEQGLVARWHAAGLRSSVVLDPRVRFGAPIVEGVPTWLVKERWEQGEPLAEISDELDITVDGVRDALRFEGIDPAASPPRKWLH